MEVLTVTELIPMLQTAIGPAILISGVGLLLLTMTNRLGRTIDRARILADKLPQSAPPARTAIEGQIAMLWSRARLLQLAISLVALSALGSALLVIVVFITTLLQLEAPWLISVLFMLALLSLILGLIVFIQDIRRSLNALRLELKLDELRR